jgi:hypothetical protein
LPVSRVAASIIRGAAKWFDQAEQRVVVWRLRGDSRRDGLAREGEGREAA